MTDRSVTVVAPLMWNRLPALLRCSGHLGSLLTSVECTLCLTETTAGSDVRYDVVVRPSVCRLFVTFVHPTQAIEIFGNVLRHLVAYVRHLLTSR